MWQSRNIVKPPPINGYLSLLEEETAGQKEECCCGYDYCIPCDVTRHECTDKHHICISSNKRGIKCQPEIQETAFQAEHFSGYGSKCESLNSEKWEVNNEGRNNI
ncbi:hypothetical protein V8G54_004296 [Vigna mungo]|uniref:Uncharacterized protein n=1 Tax=Vigna mungo TaxID=3915 RepID=A0AAQ3PDJ9_VIGMU